MTDTDAIRARFVADEWETTIGLANIMKQPARELRAALEGVSDE